MRVFLSWSGESSHKVACVLKEWLPSVIQSIRPYVSSQDIDKGARWSTDIAKELHESTFGILCVTRANIDAPWINFEAGALSKTIERSSVAPFLFDIKRSEVQGPLLQFQSTVNEKDDVFKLIASLNSAMPDVERLEELPLKKSFDVWWPELERALSGIVPSDERPKSATADRPGKLAHSEAILEEILDLTRSQQRLLRTPEELFPRGYVEHLFRNTNRDRARTEETIHMMHLLRKDFQAQIRQMQTLNGIDGETASKLVEQLATQFEVMMRRAEFLLREPDLPIRRTPLPRRPTSLDEKLEPEM